MIQTYIFNDKSTPWIDLDHESHRYVKRFAWYPTKTFDSGWIWFEKYYLHQIIHGWGFYDEFPYKDPILMKLVDG